MPKAASLWVEAKPLMIPFEGNATTIHILDLPPAFLSRCVDQFEAVVGRITPHMIASWAYGDDPPTWNEDIRSRVLAPSDDGALHLLVGPFHNGLLQLHIWAPAPGGLLCLELVFFADDIFPDQHDDGANEQIFGEIVGQVDNIRRDAPGARCLLTPLESCDPREEISKERGLVW